MKKKIYVFILILIGMTIIFSSKVHAINREIAGNFATDGSTIRIFEGQELIINYKSTWDNNDGTIAMKIKNNTYYNGYIRDSNNKKQWTEKHYYEDNNFKVEFRNYTIDDVKLDEITYHNYKNIYFNGKKATNKPVKITIISETGREQQLNIEILAPLTFKTYENTAEGEFDGTIEYMDKVKEWGLSYSLSRIKDNGTPKKETIDGVEYSVYDYENYKRYQSPNGVNRLAGKTERRRQWGNSIRRK